MNKGGSQDILGLRVTMTDARHSSGFVDNGQMVYMGEPAGYVIRLEDGRVLYYSGDTCLFGDMKLIAERTPLDVAIVPIGGHYTMGVDDAAYACGLLDAGTVLPMHYDTFPAIEADAGEFKQKVESGTDAEVVVLEPGGTHTV